MINFSEDEFLDLIDDLNPQLDSSKRNYIIDCPSCGERECSISVDKPYLWGCFRLKRCGDRGNVWKILKILGKEIKSTPFVDNTETIDLNKLINKNSDEVHIDFTVEDTPTVLKPFGWSRVFSNKYLDSRGFKSYDKCEVGVATLDRNYKNYIIFLVRENKEIKGYVGRHIWEKDKIEKYNKKSKKPIKRYKNSYGTDFSKLLYGYDDIVENDNKPVILVEGIFDKLAVDEKLRLNEERFAYTCGTFKAFISNSQIAKLLVKGVKDIILFYDPDVISIVQRNVVRLVQFFNVKIIIADNDKDPDEMSQGELIKQFFNNVYEPSKVLNDFIQLRF